MANGSTGSGRSGNAGTGRLTPAAQRTPMSRLDQRNQRHVTAPGDFF